MFQKCCWARVFGTCIQLDVNPAEYLEWLLCRINNTSIQQIHTITPDAYKKSLGQVEVFWSDAYDTPNKRANPRNCR